jgi:archaeal type IV pilus assembly protein PilA
MKKKKQFIFPDQGRFLQKKRDDAVSPVIGVMLMLVVTIIIAAVVSGFAGGLIGQSSSQKAPALNMDVKISNSGGYRGSELSMDVTGVSDPIPTKDLKIITSWTTTVKTNYYFASGSAKTGTKGKGIILGLANGTVYHGGAVVLPGIRNSYTQKTAVSVAPYGFGPGVENITNASLSETVGFYINGNSYDTVGPKIPMYNWQDFTAAHFGNYSLEQGTVMMAEAGGRCINYPQTGGVPDTSYNQGGYGAPVGGGTVRQAYAYVDGGAMHVYTGSKTTPTEIVADGGQVDGMQAMLGIGWENLRAGDVVNIKIVHIPSGKTIFDKDVVVSDS